MSNFYGLLLKTVFLVLLVLHVIIVVSHGAPRGKKMRTHSKGLTELSKCYLTPDPGSCGSTFRRWYYDSEIKQCKSFSWTGCDGNDNRFRSRGQCERQCKGSLTTTEYPLPSSLGARCPRLRCDGLECPSGHEINDQGCKICSCRKSGSSSNPTARPMSGCPFLNCSNVCLGGFRKDNKGCQTCDCLLRTKTTAGPSFDVPPSDEEPLSVKKTFEEPSDGSPLFTEPFSIKPLVEVRPEVTQFPIPTPGRICPISVCSINCTNAVTVQDENGCDVCQCTEFPEFQNDKCLQHLIECNLNCSRSGYLMDENGCPVCKCLLEKIEVDEKETEKISAEFEKVTAACPDITQTCLLECPIGYEKDSKSCDLCECHPLSDETVFVENDITMCSPISDECSLLCQGGLQRDPFGCEMCVCNGVAENQTLETDCLAAEECLIECPYGRVKNLKGCDICECSVLEKGESFTEQTVHEKTEQDHSVISALEDDEQVQTTRSEKLQIPDDQLVNEEEEQDSVTQHAEEVEKIDYTTKSITEELEEVERIYYTTMSMTEEVEEVEKIDYTTKSMTEEEEESNQTTKAPQVEVEPDQCDLTDECESLHCEFGSGKSKNGCCECNDAPSYDSDVTIDYHDTPVVSTFIETVTPSFMTPTIWSADAISSPETSANSKTETQLCSNIGQCRKLCWSGNYLKDDNGCQLCECAIPDFRADFDSRHIDSAVMNSRKKFCSLLPVAGPCHAELTRWSYNPAKKVCETFAYGGCRGNANNFPSEKSCTEYCTASVNESRTEKQAWYRKILGLGLD